MTISYAACYREIAATSRKPSAESDIEFWMANYRANESCRAAGLPYSKTLDSLIVAKLIEIASTDPEHIAIAEVAAEVDDIGHNPAGLEQFERACNHIDSLMGDEPITTSEMIDLAELFDGSDNTTRARLEAAGLL